MGLILLAENKELEVAKRKRLPQSKGKSCPLRTRGRADVMYSPLDFYYSEILI